MSPEARFGALRMSSGPLFLSDKSCGHRTASSVNRPCSEKAQEASVAAWQNGDDVRHPAAWMQSTVWRLSRRAEKAKEARQFREARVAQSSSVASASDVSIRFEEQHMLSEVVRSLPDKQRDVISLRFYEGIPPRRIAKRLGVPVETVYTRLERALDRLRKELDDAHGGNRGAWVTALLPLTQTKTSSLLATLMGGIALKKTIAIGVLLASLGLYFVNEALDPPSLFSTPAGIGEDSSVRDGDEMKLGAPVAVIASPPLGDAKRESVHVSKNDDEAGRTILVRVVDDRTGIPVPQASVYFANDGGTTRTPNHSIWINCFQPQGPVHATSDDGSVNLPRQTGAYRIVARADIDGVEYQGSGTCNKLDEEAKIQLLPTCTGGDCGPSR